MAENRCIKFCIYNFDVNPVTCESCTILTRIIRSSYITTADSHHFDRPAERRLFEDVAGVSGNSCIKHDSSVSNKVTTRTDSRHFHSPAERRLFEEVADVRCIQQCKTMYAYSLSYSRRFILSLMSPITWARPTLE